MATTDMLESAAPAALAGLAAMVVKDHVRLGVLARGDQMLALALVWAGLPADDVLDERGINAEIKHQLANAARFLDTDHVELRRWLVDAGWLTRDGFGRAYRRVAAGELPPAAQAAQAPAALLQGLDSAAWCRAERERKAAQRAARQLAWQARGGAAP